MKKKKYLPLYEAWMNAGEMPDGISALCDYFGYIQFPEFELLRPTNDDFHQLSIEGYSTYTWGSGDLNKHDDAQFFKFTPLRQNIVLLMACLNNEL